MAAWCSGLSHLPVTQKIAGSNPAVVANLNFIKFLYIIYLINKDTYSKYFCRWFVKPVVVGSSPAFQVFENSSTGRARVKMRVSCLYGELAQLARAPALLDRLQ